MFTKYRQWIVIPVSAAAAILGATALVEAATTISTSITTGGDVTVTGNVYASSTVQGTNITDWGNTTLTGTLAVTGQTSLASASSTSLSVTGKSYFGGSATTTVDSAGNLVVAGTATVGSSGSAITSMQFGFCTIPSTTVNASTTNYASCTGAGTVDNTYRVILQATSSLADNFIIEAASSTATAGTISVKILNTGLIAGTATGINSFTFWAFK